MLKQTQSETKRTPLLLTIKREFITQARELKINLSKAAEVGIREAIGKAKTVIWQKTIAKL